MGGTAIAVTPTLFVGGSPTFAYTRCTTAEEARDVIDGGGRAVLPDGDWAAAEQTLRLLGIDEDWIENCLHFAQTGEILPTISRTD